MNAQKKGKLLMVALGLVSVLVCAGTSFAATKSEAGNPNRSIVSFEESPAPELTNPFSGSEAQLAELKKFNPAIESLEKAIVAHNVLNSLRSYRDATRSYNDMKRLHEKTLSLLGQSEQCVVTYLGRYFNNPVKVWSRIDMKDHPENHDIRGGLSAWAIEAFDTAKAAQLSPLGIDDTATISNEMIMPDDQKNLEFTEDNVADYDKDETSFNVEELHKEKGESFNTFIDSRQGVYFKEPSKQDEYEKDARLADILAKDIGTNASLMLVEEPTKWGSVKKPFPVWNDQKTFYNQYLDGKYSNIEDFINVLEVSPAVKNRINQALLDDQKKFMTQAEYDIDNAALRAIAVTNATYVSEYNKIKDKYEADYAAVGKEADSKVTTLNNEESGKQDSLDGDIRGLQSQRDFIASIIDDINVNNNQLSDEIRELQVQMQAAQALLDKQDISEEDRLIHAANKAAAAMEMNQAQSKIDQYKKELKTQEKAYNELSDKIDAKKAAKNTLKNEYIVKVADVRQKEAEEKRQLKALFDEENQKLLKESGAKVAKINAASLAAKAALGTNSSVTVQQITSTTDLIIDVAKQDAIQNIKKTRDILATLGDDLYRGNKHVQVLGYHNAMVSSLKGEKASFGGLELEPVLGKVKGVTTDLTNIVSGQPLEKNLNEMYVTLRNQYIQNTNVYLKVKLFDEALQKVSLEEDTQYFVGSTGKMEDFRGPKTMPDFNLPPLREYVRMDLTDLTNISDGSKMMESGHMQEIKFGDKVIGSKFVPDSAFKVAVIDKQRVLDYGGRVPQIWKMMLKDKAFVESDFFLSQSMVPANKKIISQGLKLGGEQGELFRGGIYPCLLKNIKAGKESCNISGSIENGVGVMDVDVDTSNASSGEYSLGLSFVKGARRGELLNRGLSICTDVEVSCKKIKLPLIGEKVYTEIGLGSKPGNPLSNLDRTVPEGQYSELGTLFAVNSGKVDGAMVYNALTLSPDAQSVLNYTNRIYELSKNQEINFSGNEKKNADLYNNALLTNNQVGDFLAKVELEQTARKSLEELQTSLDEMKANLHKSLASVGFVPNDDFDISLDKDYNLAAQKMKILKQSRLSLANKDLDSVNAEGSEYLQDSKKTYTNISAALALDKEGVKSMSMGVEDNTALDEELRTSRANQTADDRYQENAARSFEDELNGMNSPYCAAY